MYIDTSGNTGISLSLPLNESSLDRVWKTDKDFVQKYNLQNERGINNGNCTEWSAIWCEIKRVITKLHDREAGVQFVSTSLISHQNCTTRSHRIGN